MVLRRAESMNHMVLNFWGQNQQTSPSIGPATKSHIYLHGRVSLHGLPMQQLAEQGCLPTVAGTAQQNSWHRIKIKIEYFGGLDLDLFLHTLLGADYHSGMFSSPDLYIIRYTGEEFCKQCCGSGSRRAKMIQNNIKKLINFILWSAGCSFLRAEGLSCSLDVL